MKRLIPLAVSVAVSIGVVAAMPRPQQARTMGVTPTPEAEAQQVLAGGATHQLVVLRAFLRTIASVEANCPGIEPYRVMVTCKELTSFADHPRQDHYFRSNMTSNAAGAYQFVVDVIDPKTGRVIADTWDEVRATPNIKWFDEEPFSPRNQDLAASILLIQNGTYAVLMEGITIAPDGSAVVSREVFAQATHKSCHTWAAFPCADGQSAYSGAEWGNQNAKELDHVWDNFQKFLAEENSKL